MINASNSKFWDYVKNNQMLYSYFIINAIGKFCTFYNIWEGLEIIIIMPEGFEMLVHC